MQSAQHAFAAAAVVVLNKVQGEAGGLVKGFLVEAFIKEAARVAEHFGFDHKHIRNGSWRDFHDGLASVNKRCRY